MKNPKARSKLLFSVVLVSGFLLGPHLGLGQNTTPEADRSPKIVTLKTSGGGPLKMARKFSMVDEYFKNNLGLSLVSLSPSLGLEKPGDAFRFEMTKVRASTVL